MLPPEVLARFGVRPDEVEKLREKGAAHTHWRLGKSGLLLRVPRLSQWGMGPEQNLAYQVACFRRAEPSGATPRLAEVIVPSPSLPRGALAVEEIVGRVPRLLDDLPAIAAALAALWIAFTLRDNSGWMRYAKLGSAIVMGGTGV